MTTLIAKSCIKSCLSNFGRLSATQRFASTYKAAILEKAGEPLVIKELTRVKLKKNQIRIKVDFCSVNSMDLKSFRSGTQPLPFVPGYELSGRILEIADKINNEEELKVDEKVAAINLKSFGGLAEECVVDINDVWRLPHELSREDAAIMIFGHSTALYTFGNLCVPSKTDKIIITAGSAGLGLAGVDVAANVYKAKVLAVTETETQSEVTRQTGAFQTLHFNEKLRKNVLDLCNQTGADIIYDSLGGETLKVVSTCVTDNGKIFSAFSVDPTIPTPPAHASFTVVNLLTLKEQNLELYRQIVSDTLEMANDGILTAHISDKFEFKDVNKALEFIDSKKCTGKVVVKVD